MLDQGSANFCEEPGSKHLDLEGMICFREASLTKTQQIGFGLWTIYSWLTLELEGNSD